MLKYFYCPDGKKILTSDCLCKCVSPNGRCLSRYSLIRAESSYRWSGAVDTDQLLNPTRMEYLKYKCSYGIYPQDAFCTKHDYDSEIDEQKPGSFILITHRLWASAAVAKFLSDKPNGTKHDLELALNLDRISLEGHNQPVSRLFVEIEVKDAGINAAVRNGIDFKVKLLPIRLLDNDEILFYFYDKYTALTKAIKDDILPAMCDYSERWEGRRCKVGCDVFRFCPDGAQINKVKYEAT
jgi:hypothetical protein